MAAAVAEFPVGGLLAAPTRVGTPLRRDLQGLWSARRGPYRVVYEIDEAAGRVVVLRIDHRADVYDQEAENIDIYVGLYTWSTTSSTNGPLRDR